MSENTATIAATRVSPEVLAHLKAAAQAADRSVSAELRRLVTTTYSAPVTLQSTGQ